MCSEWRLRCSKSGGSIVPAVCMPQAVTQGTRCNALVCHLIPSLWRSSLHCQIDSLANDQILDFELLGKDLIWGDQ